MSDFDNFKGTARRIDDIDLPRLGHRIGVGEDELHALIDTETNGKGFDNQGRPKMLFEAHRFYANLAGAERDAAVKAGLARKTWKVDGKVPKYPTDSYPTLKKAMAINRTAALRSASWGLGQIMGENHKLAGYATVEQMVREFMADEANHLDAMVTFIVATGIDDDLRTLAALDRVTLPDDCIPIVRVYNGSGFRNNDYHTKFANNHNKWRKIPDTPWTPDVPYAPVKVPVDKTIVANVQTLLIERGYFDVGTIDGLMGTKTRGAIAAFQVDNNMALTGEISDELLAALVRSPKREVSIERELATAKDLKAQGNEVVSGADLLKKIGIGIITASGLGGLVEGTSSFEQISHGITSVKKLTDAVGLLSPWVLLAVGGGLVVYFGGNIVKRQVEAYQAGRSL